MLIEVIDSNSEDFPSGSEHDFSDFVLWLHLGMLPSKFVFTCFNKYWRVTNQTFVERESECYSAVEFALYRGRLGVTEEDETKAQILRYIKDHTDVRYRTIANALNVSGACIGYHIADLKMRGLVDTGPLAITDLGEHALTYLPL